MVFMETPKSVVLMGFPWWQPVPDRKGQYTSALHRPPSLMWNWHARILPFLIPCILRVERAPGLLAVKNSDIWGFFSVDIFTTWSALFWQMSLCPQLRWSASVRCPQHQGCPGWVVTRKLLKQGNSLPNTPASLFPLVGGLDLAIEGPSKAEISCIDNKDGTCTVTYLPTLPGDYSILVKYNDKHIPGSPFTAKITGMVVWLLGASSWEAWLPLTATLLIRPQAAG